VKNLEEEYLKSLQVAREKVAAVSDPGSRVAFEAVLETVSRLHMMLMKHESATSKSLFDMEARIQNVLFNT
jgi:hypothetical protein